MGLNSFSFRFLLVFYFVFLSYLLTLSLYFFFCSVLLIFLLSSPPDFDLLEPIQTKPSRLSLFFCIYPIHTFFKALYSPSLTLSVPVPVQTTSPLSRSHSFLSLSPPLFPLHSTLSSLVGCSSFLPGTLALPPSLVTYPFS